MVLTTLLHVFMVLKKNVEGHYEIFTVFNEYS
jgi:hypothetical protein